MDGRAKNICQFFKEIIKAFEKARDIRIKKGDSSPSDISVFEDISDYIEKTKNFSRTPNRYKQYFTNAKKIIDTNEDIHIKQIGIVNGLCELSGYNDYKDFCLKEGFTNKKVSKNTDGCNRLKFCNIDKYRNVTIYTEEHREKNRRVPMDIRV